MELQILREYQITNKPSNIIFYDFKYDTSILRIFNMIYNTEYNLYDIGLLYLFVNKKINSAYTIHHENNGVEIINHLNIDTWEYSDMSLIDNITSNDAIAIIYHEFISDNLFYKVICNEKDIVFIALGLSFNIVNRITTLTILYKICTIQILREDDTVIIIIHAQKIKHITSDIYAKIYKQANGWKTYNIKQNMELIYDKISFSIDSQKNNMKKFIENVNLEEYTIRLGE